jgi:hypothetical protein
MSLLNDHQSPRLDSSGIISEKYLTVFAATELTGYNGQYLRGVLRQDRLGVFALAKPG